MFKFITGRPFWVNFLAATALFLLLVFIFLQALSLITKHGQYLTVPGVINKNTPDAIDFLQAKGFEVVIQDSVYIDSLKKGIVLKQLPDPNSTVKFNRTVFLTVNRTTPPLVEMPLLEGKTINYALDVLKRSNLILGDTLFKPDWMRGSVIEQIYNGAKISAGTKLPWGSKIDLIIGSGLAEQQIVVPTLLQLTFGDAKILLEQDGISLGTVQLDADVKDTLAAFVYKQIPPAYTEDKQPVYIRPGQIMDLWLSVIPKNLEDSLKILKGKPDKVKEKKPIH